MKSSSNRAWRRIGLTLALIGLIGPISPISPVSPVSPVSLMNRANKAERQPLAPPQPSHRPAHEIYGRLPLSFEANHGQADTSVRFLSRGVGYNLFLTATEAVLQLRIADCGLRIADSTSNAIKTTNPQSAIRNPQSAVLRMKLLGANPTSQIEGLDELPGRSHYLVGNDPSRWRRDVPHYAKVRYREVYPGIDLVYYGAPQKLEYDLVIAPGADPRAIRMAFAGERRNPIRMRLDAQGDLILHTAGGEVRQSRPAVYQEVDGSRRIIASRYRLYGRGQVGFDIAGYDASRPLVIDPTLVYSTHSMGGERIVVDAQGAAYVTGATAAADFPLANPLQRQIGGGIDVFVAKLNAAGTTLIYSTFLGGSGDDSGHGVAVDAQGAVYLTGSTLSPNFPGATNPPGGNFAGGPDGFVTKLNATGSAVVYSTYLGGARDDAGADIAVDGAGAAYVAGYTRSENFPVTPNAFQTMLNRGVTPNANDAFVTKLSVAGAVTYSTFLGGANDEAIVPGDIFATLPLRMALDSSGSVYVTGTTSSRDFPLKNALQPVPGGNFTDAFVAKIDPAKSGTESLVYATYLGGNDLDEGRDIAVDASGSAYVLLDPASFNLPLTPGVFGHFARIGYLAKLNPAGSALVYATRLGSGIPIDPLITNPDSGHDSEDYDSLFPRFERFAGLAVDANGNAYLTGITNSSIFPITPNAFQRRLGGGCSFGNFACLDAFVMKLNANSSALVYSSYLGGGASEFASDIALDAMGAAYITGTSLSSDYPTTPGAFQAPTNHQGFITEISADNRSATVATVSSASFTEPVASESLVSAFGSGLAPPLERLEGVDESPLLAPLAVTVRDSAGVERLAPRFFASPSQINYQIPEGTATGEATVSVLYMISRIAIGAARIVTVAPGLFAANGNGQGVAGAVALRVKADGSQQYEPVARFDPAQGRFVAAPIDLGDASDQVFLVVFGTGFRNRSALSAVSAQIGGVDSPVLFAGAQGDFLGLDQANVRLPRSLAGRGEMDLVFVADGKAANTVRVAIR